MRVMHCVKKCSFFFNDTATTEIYTLSLHDALPISATQLPAAGRQGRFAPQPALPAAARGAVEHHADHCPAVSPAQAAPAGDRKSTRLNSSHANISYAVFCLKKKKNKYIALDQIFEV